MELFPDTHPPRFHSDPEKYDRYYTPEEVWFAIFRRMADQHRFQLRPPVVGARAGLVLAAADEMLEPCVGGGAAVRAARRIWPGCATSAVDIDEDAAGLKQADSGECMDLFDWLPTRGRLHAPKLVATNLPYAEQDELAYLLGKYVAALQQGLGRRGHPNALVLIHRSTWTRSKAFERILRPVLGPPVWTWRLPRVSFTGGGTDPSPHDATWWAPGMLPGPSRCGHEITWADLGVEP